MRVLPVRNVLLFCEAILFTVVVPGTVVVWIPRWILGPTDIPQPGAWTGLQWAALVPLAVGGVVYLWCLYDFVARGRGIPAPIDHPRQLVVSGLYRWVRNPMYLGILFILLGEVAFFGSGLLLLYASIWFLVVSLVVLLYEEPSLRRRFGTPYERYSAEVNRWIPRRPATQKYPFRPGEPG